MPFRLPLGAPGERPPWIRQRPFGIAGDRHSVCRRRVFAKQRWARRKGKGSRVVRSIGLSFDLRHHPGPRYRLAVNMDMAVGVLHFNDLLRPPRLRERRELSLEHSEQLHGQVSLFLERRA
jgi:hypothetical protein